LLKDRKARRLEHPGERPDVGGLSLARIARPHALDDGAGAVLEERGDELARSFGLLGLEQEGDRTEALDAKVARSVGRPVEPAETVRVGEDPLAGLEPCEHRERERSGPEPFESAEARWNRRFEPERPPVERRHVERAGVEEEPRRARSSVEAVA